MLLKQIVHCSAINIIFSSIILILNTKESLCNYEEWWKHGVFYQIYPRSFKDANNDGIGDLKGVINKLPHLKDAGVTATWLSPIYKSPQVDQGYDISDYKQIDPDYGTLEDFKELLVKAHELNIKIIMDFVPNHSSNQHEWFKLSENRVPGYEDYYIWADGNKTTGKQPNNWLSVFQDSAWEFSHIRNQYYLHQFAVEQPDLNYRNPDVVRAMKETLKFWLDLGVDGFRVDAVPFLFEDERLLDEPRSGENVSPNNHNYLNHIYTIDLEETFDMIYQWREFIDDYNRKNRGSQRIFMTEAYTTIENTMRYYGDERTSRLGAHFTFNFFLITDLNSNSNAQDIVKVIHKWNNHMPKKFTANWVLGNHDNNRVASRFGTENVDGFNMLLMLLPGIAVTYNGEEIGQEDGEVTYEEGKDPNACKSRRLFPKLSRDFERTPFQWDNTINAGFNRGAKPWLPVSKKYYQNNLARQSFDNIDSHFNVYKQLVKLRQNGVFKYGTFSIKAATENILVLSRSYNSETWIFVFNVGNSRERINLNSQLLSLPKELVVVIKSINSNKHIAEQLETNYLELEPHESLLLTDSYAQSSASYSSLFSGFTTFLKTIFSYIIVKYFEIFLNK